MVLLTEKAEACPVKALLCLGLGLTAAQTTTPAPITAHWLLINTVRSRTGFFELARCRLLNESDGSKFGGMSPASADPVKQPSDQTKPDLIGRTTWTLSVAVDSQRSN